MKQTKITLTITGQRVTKAEKERFEAIGYKYCSKCKVAHPKDYFYTDKRSVDGLTCWCIDQRKKSNHIWSEACRRSAGIKPRRKRENDSTFIYTTNEIIDLLENSIKRGVDIKKAVEAHKRLKPIFAANYLKNQRSILVER